MSAVFDYGGYQSLLKHQKTFAICKTKILTGHKSKVHSVAWCNDGSLLASGATDCVARIWSLTQTGCLRETLELKGHTQSIDQLCWDPLNSNCLCTVSMDKSVRTWDSRNGKIIQNFNTNAENINVTWHPDGTRLAVGTKNDTVVVLDARTLAPLKSIPFNFEVNEIAWSENGLYFLVSTGHGSVCVLDGVTFDAIGEMHAHAANCYCLKFDAAGRLFATGGADGIFCVWNASTMQIQRTFAGLTWPVRAVSFSFDSQFVAAGSEDPFIDVSHVDSGFSIARIQTDAAVNSLSWNPKQHILAYAAEDNGKTEGCIRLFGCSSSE